MTVTCSCSVHCGINPSGNWVRSLIPNFHRLTTEDLRANVNATSDLACQHAVSSDMTQCCSSAIHARSQRSSFKHMVMTDVKTGPAHHLLQLDTQVAIGHSTDEIPYAYNSSRACFAIVSSSISVSHCSLQCNIANNFSHVMQHLYFSSCGWLTHILPSVTSTSRMSLSQNLSPVTNQRLPGSVPHGTIELLLT